MTPTSLRLASLLLALPSAMPVMAQPTSLALSGPGQQTTITPEALKAMAHVQVTVLNGHTHARETYAGVPLIQLVEKVGAPEPSAVRGKALARYVVAEGSDGYKAVLSLAEIEPGFHPGLVLVADSLDGKPLDAKEGPLKLVVEEDTRPARAVHNLVRLELKQAE